MTGRSFGLHWTQWGCRWIRVYSGGGRAEFPQLADHMRSAGALYVCTDAGLLPSGDYFCSPVVGGLAVVIATGDDQRQCFSWSVHVSASSSSDLEWLAKLVGLWIVRDYAGAVYVLCDNSAAHLCAFSRALSLSAWVDRVAKVILSLPIVLRVSELWVEAQHDSLSVDLAPEWQAEADRLSTFAIRHPGASPFPIKAFCALSTPASVPLFFNDALVLSNSRFFDALYDRVCGKASPVGTSLRSHGWCMVVWSQVLHDAGVTLQSHRMAAYLRLVPSQPRPFTVLPDCRFCGYAGGAVGGHFVRCPALYVRMCHALVSVRNTLRWHMTARLVDAWDVSATLQCTSGVTLTVSVSCHESQEGASDVEFSWSGLVRCSPRARPLVSSAILQRCCRAVLRIMALPVGFQTPPQADAFLLRPPDEVVLLVAAWYVRYDPRAVCVRVPWALVHVPCDPFHASQRFRYDLQCCVSKSVCRLWMPPPHGRAMVICACRDDWGVQHPAWEDVRGGLGWAVRAAWDFAVPPLAPNASTARQG